MSRGTVSGNGTVTNGLVLALDAGNLFSYPGSGTVWTDLTSNRNSGTLTNGPTFNSANGGSVVFDGSNDFVSFSSYNFGNELTVFCFIRPESLSNIMTIFANSIGGATTSGIRLFLNNFQTSDRVVIIEVGNGSANSSIKTTSAIITYDTWQQIAFTLNKTTAIGAIYLNGFSVPTDTSSLTLTNYNSSAAFRFGLMADNQFPYKGRLSNYLIYNRSLSAAEILQNYNALKGRFGLT